jgi:hypothetical protein
MTDDEITLPAPSADHAAEVILQFGQPAVAMTASARDLPLGTRLYTAPPAPSAEPEIVELRADAARYRLLASLMVHVSHPAGSGWTLDEVLVSGDRDFDDVIDALAKEPK